MWVPFANHSWPQEGDTNGHSMFGVQDAAGEPGYSQRDHDTGPLKYIIRGPDDDYNVC